MATPNNATTGDVDDDSVGGGGMLSLEEDLRIGEQQHQAKQHHHHQAAAAVIQVPIINSNNGTTSNGRRRLLNNNMSSSSSVSTEFQKNFGKLHHIISTTDSTTSTTGSSSLLLEGSSLSGGGGGGERVSSSSSALFAMTTNTVTSKNRRESMKRMEETFTANKLRFSSLELVGREKELQILQECFERCCGSDGGTGTTTTTTTTGGGTRELVFLKGGSGTGKTSLAKHFVKRNNIKMAPVVVGFGKFDFLIRDDKPLSGFVDAFSSLFIQLQETVRLPIKAYTEFRSSLLDTFCDEEEEEELRILLSMIPTIQKFFLNDDNHHHPSSNRSENNGGNDIVSSSATTTTNSVSSGSSRKDTSSSTPPSAMMHGSSSTTDGDGDDSIISAEATSQRMKNLFRKLCRVWTDHLAPLVIILDDLQWADQASLDLLETIFNDLENSKILVICSFRSEDVRNNGGVIVGNNNHSNDNDDGDHQQHPVNRLRTNLTKRTCRGSNITDIEIGNLSLQHTHSVINTLLSMEDEPEEEKTLELARICQRRTAGNVFFLLQFLVMLKEEELLEFNLGLYKWRWDLNKIESETAATANVVGMVTERLVSKLPSQLLSFLQLASCLGSSFHDRTLSLVWDHHVSSLPEDDDDNNQESEGEGARDPQHRADFQSVLDLAERNNFLEKDATNLRELSSHRWLHDNIQQAAMASITPSSHIDVLKCRVGISLLRHLTKEDLNREIFVVANLLTAYKPDNNNGNEALTVTPRVVELFLKAAEKASSVAAFQSAFRYSKNGIKLLPLDCWNTCFDHTLRLYSIATEASGFLGQIDEMLTYSAKVLDQPKCSIFDKLRAYFVKLELLQNNGEPFEAVDLGLQILRNLGCSFPKSTAGQVVQTIRALHKWKTKPPKEAQLRQLSPMADRKAKEIVKVIFRLEASFYYTKQIFLYALSSSRAVELVLDKGLCDYSGGAFFALGNILAALNGDLSYLRKWCDLSVLMTQLVPSGHHESRVIFSIGCGYMWSKPSANVPKNLLRGYKIGMRVGDTERLVIYVSNAELYVQSLQKL